MKSPPFSTHTHTTVKPTKSAGFTLVEILIALSLLGLLTVMLFTSFYSVTRAWETGRNVIDSSGHSDYLMEQLTAALRSAYTPGTGEKYGLIFLDDGEDERAHDSIEWSKVGPALVGEDAEFAHVPHRIRVQITEPEDDFPGGFTVRAWRQDLQLDDFNPEEDTTELCLSPKVIGFNCRMLDPDEPRTTDDEINWIDEWTKTNMLPTAVELTLWMEPAEDDGEPIESRRIVEIPMGVLSQNPNQGSTANEEARGGTSTSIGGGRRRRGRENVIIETGRGQRPSNNNRNPSAGVTFEGGVPPPGAIPTPPRP
jgi:prepilin-type N-terminal cleavage/methylation domain-containing protein